MKNSIIIIIVSLATTATSTILAETPFEREFVQLREQRAKAVAAAVDPINRKYQATLDQLLRRATQGNDLDTAIKLKAELERVPKSTETNTSAASLRDQIIAHKWFWWDKTEVMSFSPEGTAELVYPSGSRSATWEQISERKIKVTTTTGKFSGTHVFVEFNPTFKKGQVTGPGVKSFEVTPQ